MIVENFEPDRSTPALLKELSELCVVQQKTLQAAGWDRLAKQALQ